MSPSNRTRLTLTALALGLAAGSGLPAGSTVAGPPPTPVVKSNADLPWWRQAVAHTAQEQFFLTWMDFEFGNGWLDMLPDEFIDMLWVYFETACYEKASAD